MVASFTITQQTNLICILFYFLFMLSFLSTFAKNPSNPCQVAVVRYRWMRAHELQGDSKYHSRITAIMILVFASRGRVRLPFQNANPTNTARCSSHVPE